MLRREVASCMQEYSEDGDAAIFARFAFPPSFSGFRGHFPDNPVLPGVCIIQCVLVMLERREGCPMQLLEIERAKYMRMVAPEDALSVHCRLLENAGEYERVSARVSQGDDPISELKLKVRRKSNGTEK